MRTLVHRKRQGGALMLPAVGPFAGLTPKLPSSVPNRTISSDTDLSNLSSRTSPLEYNTLTITNGVISAPTSYFIAIRGNILNMTGGSFDVSGQAGYVTVSGGSGACGGGGGGGAASGCDPCDINGGGEGGNELGPALLDGLPGQDGSASPGKQGGTGYGDNWKNDGYNYLPDLGGNFSISNTPFLYGGYGSNGGFNCAVLGFEGGSGGGCAGGVILQFNKIIGSGLPQLLAVGGGAETGGDGNVAQGGDGGWFLVYARHYPTAFLNGRVNVNADPFGQFNGSGKLFKIIGKSYSAVAGFGTPF